MVEQMIANLQAAANDDSQSSQGSDEDGEDEDEEVQASDSDGDLPDTKPAYAKGSPQELLQPVVDARKAEEGAKVADQTDQ